MWLILGSASSGVYDIARVVGIWGNWSSFGPDLLVAGVTGLVVGGIVLYAERRISNRARAREITNAQSGVVETARSILTSPLSFKHDAMPSLMPAARHFERLRKEAGQVPAGQPSEYVVGYYWVSKAITASEQLHFQAEGLLERFAEYERMAGDGIPLVRVMVVNMQMFVVMQPDPPLPWNIGRVPHNVKKAMQADQELNSEVEAYIRQRRLLEAYRKAFLQADGAWRADAWIATVAMATGAPHNFLKTRFRKRKMNRAIEAAKIRADAAAQDIVSAVDPMAA